MQTDIERVWLCSDGRERERGRERGEGERGGRGRGGEGERERGKLRGREESFLHKPPKKLTSGQFEELR